MKAPSALENTGVYVTGAVWWGNIVREKITDLTRASKLPNQWLLYGPWSHAFNTARKFGDQDYGSGAILELDSLYLRWFDTWLKGKEVGLAKVPRVRAFLTGANEWLDMNDWPDSRAKEKTLYLGASAPANGRNGGGQLLDASPAESEPDPVTPGKVYKANIELWDTAHRFLPGHRVGILIESSMFPLYARNLNTGEPIKYATRMVAAHETIYHDRSHPSALYFYTAPAGHL